MIEDLRSHLPHRTPVTADEFVYTTVEEAGSANITDVGNYLDKLKLDLHIGEEGHPQKVLLTGDQQTYINQRLAKEIPYEI